MKTFLIASLAAAGFQEKDFAEDQYNNSLNNENEGLEIILERTLPFTFVGHSSHRSHGSHRSHSSHGSHRSSSGGATPRYSPSPTPPSSESTKPNTILPLVPKAPRKGEQYKLIVQRVQAGLFMLGYYTGSLDGNLSSETMLAILRYQINNGLPTTGTIDDRLIKSLGIPIE